MKPILQVENLTKEFENDGRPAYRAVDDASSDAAHSDYYCLS